MPTLGCFCWGGNTPELDNYCCCQDKGDKADYERRCAAAQPHLDAANKAYHEDGDEMTAMEHCYQAWLAAGGR